MVTQPAIFQRSHLIRDTISMAIYDTMRVDSTVYLFGEGCEVKQHYDAPYILAEFPDRIVTMPISEDGNTNFAVGASLLGVKPVVDVISGDFLYRTMDSICNTAAKLNFVRPNEPPKTIVIRAEFLTGGPTTGQRPEALFAHIPALRVVIPSTPRDAYGTMRSALATPGVTVFFEDRMIQDDDDWTQLDLSPAGPFPLGASRWCHKGQRGNVTIVSYGIMRQVMQRILRKYTVGRDFYADDAFMWCDLIDLVSLAPIDFGFITKMVERTGRLLIVEPDVQYGGIGAEIAAYYQERRPHVRVKRLGAPMKTIPAAMSLHSQMLPSEAQIIAAIRDW